MQASPIQSFTHNGEITRAVARHALAEQVLILSMFSTGMLSCAAAVVGAAAAGLATVPRFLAYAFFTIVLVVGFFVRELYKMLIFRSYHLKECWQVGAAL